MLPNLAAKIETIASGNHDVENEEDGALALRLGDQCIAGGKQLYRIPGCLEVMANEARDIRIVFHNKDAGFHTAIVRPWRRSAYRHGKVRFR
jgi:hypothetical protein